MPLGVVRAVTHPQNSVGPQRYADSWEDVCRREAPLTCEELQRPHASVYLTEIVINEEVT